MGLLANSSYWAEALNQMAQLKPPLGQAISARDAAQIRSIACRVLSDLIGDKDFKQDLAAAIRLAEGAAPVDSYKAQGFQYFLDAFMVLESKILADANVDTIASRDLEREIRRVASDPDPNRLHRLDEKIVFCRNLACDPSAVEDPARPIWERAWVGVKGVGVLGIDLGVTGGSAVVLGVAAAAVVGSIAGMSCSYGAALVSDSVKGRW